MPSYNPAQELSSIAFDKIIGGSLDAVVKAQNNSALTTVSFIKNVGFSKNEQTGAESPVYVDFKYPKEIVPYQPATVNSSIIILNGGTGYTSEIKATVDGKPIGVNFDVVDGVITSAIPSNLAEMQEFSEGDKDVTIIQLKDATGKEPGSGAKLTLHIFKKDATPAKYQDMTLQVPLLTMVPIPFIRIDNVDLEFNVKINTVNTNTSEDNYTSNVSNTTSAGYKAFYSPVTVSTTFNASVSTQKKNSSIEDIKREYSLSVKIHAIQDEMPIGASRILDILEDVIISTPCNTPAIAGK